MNEFDFGKVQIKNALWTLNTVLNVWRIHLQLLEDKMVLCDDIW